jgi:hypothetical protein
LPGREQKHSIPEDDPLWHAEDVVDFSKTMHTHLGKIYFESPESGFYKGGSAKKLNTATE